MCSPTAIVPLGLLPPRERGRGRTRTSVSSPHTLSSDLHPPSGAKGRQLPLWDPGPWTSVFMNRAWQGQGEAPGRPGKTSGRWGGAVIMSEWWYWGYAAGTEGAPGPQGDLSNLRQESGQQGPRRKGFQFHSLFITVLSEWPLGAPLGVAHVVISHVGAYRIAHLKPIAFH